MITWRKSSHSGSTSTQSDCLEVAVLDTKIAIRDSKSPDTGHLVLTPQAFAALLTRAKHGELPGNA